MFFFFFSEQMGEVSIEVGSKHNATALFKY